MHISVLNGALWDMELVHSEIGVFGLLNRNPDFHSDGLCLVSLLAIRIG